MNSLTPPPDDPTHPDAYDCWHSIASTGSPSQLTRVLRQLEKRELAEVLEELHPGRAQGPLVRERAVTRRRSRDNDDECDVSGDLAATTTEPGTRQLTAGWVPTGATNSPESDLPAGGLS